MISKMFFRFNLVFCFIIALVGVSACAPKHSVYKAPIKADVSERAPVGLPFDVQNFTWSYVGGERLEVTGTIKNNGRQARRGVIYAMMFDEKGFGVAMGESSISPAVLKPGQSGTFTIVAKTSRPQRTNAIRHLRLMTNTQGE